MNMISPRCAFALAALVFSGAPHLSYAEGPPLKLKAYASGFIEPVHIAHPPVDKRLFVVEHAGVIRVIEDGKVLEKPFLDLSKTGLDKISRIQKAADERGLLGLAFHPDYAKNRKFYVSYTNIENDASVVAEYHVSPDNPNIADTTEKLIFGPVAQPQNNHNGGHIDFGHDGLLYFALGDGGMRADQGPGHNPQIGNGQDLTTYLGKLIRIDVNNPQVSLPYGIPKDNPFAGKKGTELPEIYAWGLRNVWKFSFDRADGRLFAADVGQDLWEEIDIIGPGGGNYGWRPMEGSHCFNPKRDCRQPGMIDPIFEYPHQPGGNLSVTGGYVYRGKAHPRMVGQYVFGDYVSGRIWAIAQQPDGAWRSEELYDANFAITTFGEDADGELYVADYLGGIIHRLIFE